MSQVTMSQCHNAISLLRNIISGQIVTRRQPSLSVTSSLQLSDQARPGFAARGGGEERETAGAAGTASVQLRCFGRQGGRREISGPAVEVTVIVVSQVLSHDYRLSDIR